MAFDMAKVAWTLRETTSGVIGGRARHGNKVLMLRRVPKTKNKAPAPMASKSKRGQNSPRRKRTAWQKARSGLGRAVLGIFRPVFGPLLRRLETRLARAVGTSGPAKEALRRSKKMERSLRAVTRQVDKVRKALGPAAAADGGSPAAVAEPLADARALVLERLSLTLDALYLATLDRHDNADMQRRLGGVGQSNEPDVALSHEVLRIREVCERIEELIARQPSLAPAASITPGEGREELAHLGKRLDDLLRRVALPLDGDFLIRSDEGYLLVPAEDVGLVTILFETGGRMEPGTVSLIVSQLQAGDYAVDVGANVGTITLPMARKVGAGGRVLAVEPASRVATLLARTIALNGLSDRVSLSRVAAASAEGAAQLNLSEVSGHSSLLPLPGATDVQPVRLARLDDLVPPGQAVRLVKLDAEGAELDILRGMSRIVDESPSLICVVEFGAEHLRRAGVEVKDWVTAFSALGHAYEIDETSSGLAPLRAVERMAGIESINLVFSKFPLATEGNRSA
jgi:FkbM family methyltransferase